MYYSFRCFPNMYFLNEYHVPSDLMCKIMTYIDVDDVFSMRLVSRNWSISVRNMVFIQYYNRESFQANRSCHILVCEIGSGLYRSKFFVTVSKSRIGHETWRKINLHPLHTSEHNVDIIGIVGGIICMKSNSNGHDYMFVISNPMTGQHINVAPPSEYTNDCKCFLYVTFEK